MMPNTKSTASSPLNQGNVNHIALITGTNLPAAVHMTREPWPGGNEGAAPQLGAAETHAEETGFTSSKVRHVGGINQEGAGRTQRPGRDAGGRRYPQKLWKRLWISPF